MAAKKRESKIDRLIRIANETGEVQKLGRLDIYPAGKGRNYAYVVETSGQRPGDKKK